MLLSPTDHERIRQATVEAEAATSGEIVCVVTEEASDYVEVPLAWATLAALVLPAVGVFLSVPWMAVLGAWSTGKMATGVSLIETIDGYVLLQWALFVISIVLLSVPSVRRAITPSGLRRSYVQRKAIEQFHAHGLHRTRLRNGILIFASLKDRAVEIVADEGINSRVQPRAWNEAVDRLIAEIKAGRPASGFVAAIGECGRLLAVHFPASGVTPNELPDEIVEVFQPKD